VGIMSTFYWKQSITTHGTRLLSITHISEPKMGEIYRHDVRVSQEANSCTMMHNMLSHVQSINMVLVRGKPIITLTLLHPYLY